MDSTSSEHSGTKPGRGPRAWLSSFVEQRASRLLAKGTHVEHVDAIDGFVSAIQPDRRGSQALRPLTHDYWLDALHTFHQRKAQERNRIGRPAPGEPGVP